MDLWSRSREVEKVQPWAERALECAVSLRRLHDALEAVAGETRLSHELRDARILLEEAARRGVKGKDTRHGV